MMTKRHAIPRAFTLIELIVSLVLILSLVIAVFQALATSRRIQKRNEIMTALSLEANAELARIEAVEWKNLAAGARVINDPKVPDMKGEAIIKDVPGLELKEITVRLSRNLAHESAIGPCEIRLSTWRGRQ